MKTTTTATPKIQIDACHWSATKRDDGRGAKWFEVTHEGCICSRCGTKVTKFWHIDCGFPWETNRPTQVFCSDCCTVEHFN